MNDTATLSRRQTAEVQAHYAQLARHYDRRWNRYSQVSLERLADALPLSGEESVLDLACGTGRLAEILRGRHPRLTVTGMDLSADMLEVARGRLPEDERTHWHQGSMESLPFPDASFDAVSCSSAFHLVPDQSRAMAEMVRVLRPGGHLCMVDWCRQVPQIHFIQWLARLAGRQYRRILNRSELEAMMQDSGLSVLGVEQFNATWFWVMMCMLARRPEA
ncbi:MAG: methyltransferase domain-containing protein [Gammaproteobacteria bacterium]|nr:methyltransferase domain-containing protein [Gammaproteobacteria bacterium]